MIQKCLQNQATFDMWKKSKPIADAEIKLLNQKMQNLKVGKNTELITPVVTNVVPQSIENTGPHDFALDLTDTLDNKTLNMHMDDMFIKEQDIISNIFEAWMLHYLVRLFIVIDNSYIIVVVLFVALLLAYHKQLAFEPSFCCTLLCRVSRLGWPS